MADNKPVDVDTGKLRATAGEVTDAAGRLGKIVSDLKNDLNAKGYPWGRHDPYGGKFTGGDSGYTKSSENLLAGADNMVASLNQVGTGITDAATKMDDMDK